MRNTAYQKIFQAEATKKELAWLDQARGYNHDALIDEEVISILVQDHSLQESVVREAMEKVKREHPYSRHQHFYLVETLEPFLQPMKAAEGDDLAERVFD